MVAPASRFVCQQCGASHAKWAGRCEGCGGWNTVIEESPRPTGRSVGRRIAFEPLAGDHGEPERLATGISELDRVFGGGMVRGTAVLVSGDPGIGKSTLLLQAMTALGELGVPNVYVSGEESVSQLRLRAKRVGQTQSPLLLAAETNVRDILASLDAPTQAAVVVIDSIQTMYLDGLDSAPGSVAQVRACAQELIRLAKRRGITLILVGHVTKDGQIAGPRVLEHMVDAVLHFEGERGHNFRILRAYKNRFGATDEIGVFEMGDRGLREVANPSALFLPEHDGDVTGSAVFAGIEGNRPILMEIQALAAPSPLATPRRAVVGWDGNRLAMLLAVLDTRCGLALSGYDVYLNVVGGLRISEPAADLAVVAALVSSLAARPMPAKTVAFGEVGLSGEVRPVGRADARFKEAAKLGFGTAICPRGGETGAAPLKTLEAATLTDMLAFIGKGEALVSPGARGETVGHR